METIKLKDIDISSDMMTASQLSNYIIESNIYKTKFEVLAFDKDIEAGTVDNLESLGALLNFTNATGTGLTYKVKATNNGRKTGFTLKTAVPKSMSDVVIDFGDGTPLVVVSTTNSSEIAYTGSNQDYSIKVNHQYQNNGKYKITLYGKNFFTLRISHLTAVLNDDLELGSNIINISSFCKDCLTLLKIDAHEYTNFKNIINLGNAFNGCKNLQIVKGMKMLLQHTGIINCYQLFANCTNLEDIDLLFPLYTVESIKDIFKGSPNVRGSILNFFPIITGFCSSLYYACNHFNDYQLETVHDKLTLTKADAETLGSVLWNSNTKFTGTTNSGDPTVNFFKCLGNDNVRKYVPANFGGCKCTSEDTVRLFFTATDTSKTASGYPNTILCKGKWYTTDYCCFNGTINVQDINKTEGLTTKQYRICGGSTLNMNATNVVCPVEIVNAIKTASENTWITIAFNYNSGDSKWHVTIV